MPDDRPLPSRWRLDAVAWTLYSFTLALGAGLALSRPLTGRDHPVGPAGDDLAIPLWNALGFGLIPAVLSGFVLTTLYVLRRSWTRLLVRASGWVVLTIACAAGADLGDWRIGAPISVYGPGGSIGALVRFQFEQCGRPPIPGLILAATILLGTALAADGLLRAIGRMLTALARMLIRGNHLVGRIGDRIILGLAALGRWLKSKWNRPKPAIEPAPAADLIPLENDVAPITRHTPPRPEIVPEPTTDPIDDNEAPTDLLNDDPVPITRSTDLTQTPLPPLRVVNPPSEESSSAEYELPALHLLADPDAFAVEDHELKLRERATLLEKTFTDFGLNIKVVGIHTGPVITQYEVALETGLRLNKVTNLSDDLALNLGVSSVRIVAPLPGRNTVGIEVPNDHRQTVRLKELIHATTAKAARFKLPIFIGKDVEGRPLVYDMASMPHLLIAGRTGTGKSVCLNAIILSFLFTRKPDSCRMIMIDPKKVELSEYGKVPHLMHPVVTDDKKAEAILGWAVDKMEERYELLRKARVRNIASYNELGWDEIIRRVDPQSEEERQNLPRSMPYIVIVVDEVGDLLMSMKKEVESHIIRLAQKSRAAGIHLILATQKPTVDVITGLIKSNLPARICFQVASRADSAVVLDEKGAEKLLGQGDMLFLQPGTSSIIRAQGAYVDDREIERVVGALEVHEPNFESELLNLKTKDQSAGGADLGEKLRDRDALYEQAIEIVVREQRGSTSLLQRALGIGYGRASRLIDFMAEDGIVGTFNGSNARDVLVTPEEWESRKNSA